MLAAVKPKEPSDAPLEEGPNPRLFPRINQLARISFFIAIGDILGGIYIGSTADYDERTAVFCLCLVLTSALGAFCGHCACKQIRERRPHQKGTGMEVTGIIGCYGCLCVGLAVFSALTQGSV